MADTPSIVIVQSFTYRGAYEEFSNRYHFNGDTPSSDAEWLAMADGLIAQLRTCFTGSVHFERAYGYVPSISSSVVQIDYNVPPLTKLAGNWTASGGKTSGDVAATTRWETGQLNSRGRKIYLRKYWHGVYADLSDPDKLIADQKGSFDSLAQKLADGTAWVGNQTLAGPHGVTAGAHATSQYLTTRTLKRRGKRPLP